MASRLIDNSRYSIKFFKKVRGSFWYKGHHTGDTTLPLWFKKTERSLPGVGHADRESKNQAWWEAIQQLQSYTAKYDGPLPRVTDGVIENDATYLVMVAPRAAFLDPLPNPPMPTNEAVKGVLPLLEMLRNARLQQPPLFTYRISPATLVRRTSSYLCLCDIEVGTAGGAPATGASSDTDPYQCPEVDPTDEARDIYALGATLYALVTGMSPPSATERTPTDTLKPAHDVNKAVSLKMSDILSKAMALDPTQRYGTLAELQEALRTTLPTSRFPVALVRLYQGVVSEAQKRVVVGIGLLLFYVLLAVCYGLMSFV